MPLNPPFLEDQIAAVERALEAHRNGHLHDDQWDTVEARQESERLAGAIETLRQVAKQAAEPRARG